MVLAGRIIIALILEVFIPGRQWTVSEALPYEMRFLADTPGFTLQHVRPPDGVRKAGGWKCRSRRQRVLQLETEMQREVII